MGRLKITAKHVWAQPVQVRVAVLFLLAFALFVGVVILSAAIADFGVLGTLATIGIFLFFVGLMWALITVANSNL